MTARTSDADPATVGEDDAADYAMVIAPSLAAAAMSDTDLVTAGKDADNIRNPRKHCINLNCYYLHILGLSCSKIV